jgi:hypothetical protein
MPEAKTSKESAVSKYMDLKIRLRGTSLLCSFDNRKAEKMPNTTPKPMTPYLRISGILRPIVSIISEVYKRYGKMIRKCRFDGQAIPVIKDEAFFIPMGSTEWSTGTRT